MPNFTYTRDIPDGPHNPSNDQPPMKANTNSIDSLLATDHYSFNNNLGGYHKQVNLVNEANPGAPAGVGSVLYSNGNELIFTNSTLAPAGVQMTNSAAAPIALPRGSTFLPGGFIMQWGTGATVGGVFNDTLVYPISTLYSAFTTAVATGNAIANIAVISPNVSVIVKNPGGTNLSGVTVYWLVIGAL